MSFCQSVSAGNSISKFIQRLFDIRNRYSASYFDEKLSLLRQLEGMKFKAAYDLKLLHSALCFIRAFPDSPRHYRLAHAELAKMEHRLDQMLGTERSKLWDTGIIGTPVHYQFSYEVAAWLESPIQGTWLEGSGYRRGRLPRSSRRRREPDCANEH